MVVAVAVRDELLGLEQAAERGRAEVEALELEGEVVVALEERHLVEQDGRLGLERREEVGVAAVVRGAGEDELGRGELGVQLEGLGELGVARFLRGPDVRHEDERVRRVEADEEGREGGLVGDAARLEDAREAGLVEVQVDDHGELPLDAAARRIVVDALGEEDGGLAPAVAAFSDELAVEDAAVAVEDAVDDLVAADDLWESERRRRSARGLVWGRGRGGEREEAHIELFLGVARLYLLLDVAELGL